MRFRTLQLSLCLLVGVSAAVLGAVSVRSNIAAFQTVGFRGDRAGGIVRVAQVQDPSSGLAAGDQILLINGVEVGAQAQAWEQALRHQPVSDLAVLRGAQVLRVTYRRPPFAPNLPYLIRVLIGSVYMLIGLYTLIRQQGHDSFLFCLWCLTSALLYLLSPVPPADTEYRLLYAGNQLARCLLPALTLHLFRIFPSPAPASAAEGRADRPAAGDAAAPANAAAGAPWAAGATAATRAGAPWVAFLYLPGAALLALHLDLMFANGRLLTGRPTAALLASLDRLDLLHLISFSLAAVFVLAIRLLRETGWERRRQLHWMILGLAGGYLPFLGLYAVPFGLGLRVPQLLAAAAVLPLAVVPLTFAYAILRYKLWDIEVIARDVAAWTLTLLLGVLGFSLVNLAISRGVAADNALGRNLLSFAAGIGLAGLLVPTRQSLSAALERLQYRGTFGRRRALLGLGRDLLHERDLGRLCGALLDRLSAGLDLDRLAIYLAQGDALVVIDAISPPDAAELAQAMPFEHEPSRGDAHDPAAGSSQDHAVAALQHLGGRDRGHRPRARRSAGRRSWAAAAPPVVAAQALDPAVWRDSEVYRLAGTELPAGAPSPAQQLFIAGYRYVFPLLVRGRGIGLVLTGSKRQQEPLNSDDLDIVRHLLDQAALAIENAQLVGQLHHQLQEVQRLQSYSDGIFESSPAGIAVLDTGGRLVTVNPAFSTLVAIGRDQLIGRTLQSVLPVTALPAAGEGPIEVSCPSLGGEVCGAPRRDLADLADRLADEPDPAAAPGERRLQMSLAGLAPGHSPDREPLRILVVYDVSERVAMEAALKEKDRLAALGMLAAGVAHEVNTPITGISSYAQLLLADTAESDPRYPILKKVERQTFRAARILNNLLEFARERPRERRAVALLPLLRESIELLGERLDRSGIDLAWEVPPAGDAIQVLGSEDELQQVFTNLLANALDAMSNQPRGRLGIGMVAEDARVVVRIQDTGSGIAPEQLKTVFQPFYSTKLHRGGTGLGLTISHDIVQRHGGTLAVESQPGAGTCFAVGLPRYRAAASQ